MSRGIRFSIVLVWFTFIIVVSIIPSGAVFALPNLFQTPLPDVELSSYPLLLAKARANGSIRVIVELRLPVQFQPEGRLTPQTMQGQRGNIGQLRGQLLNGLSAYNASVIARSDQWVIPYIALKVDADAFTNLATSPLVTSISEDTPDFPMLDSSVHVVGASTAWNMGYDGAGQTVAILDSGIEANHLFLGGRVIEEACYSVNDFVNGITSLCPNGLESQFDSGAASPEVCEGIEGCEHGTYVAGITAGNGDDISGVAKSASIIAIQVFSRFDNASDCNSHPAPCVGTYPTDQISGLHRVYFYRNSHNIAAVNMSLGGDKFTNACDSDPRTAIIDTLYSVNIATIIASGNDSYMDGIAAPACISTAVAVGATNDADQIAPFSNSSPLIDLLAPGVSITSSVPGGGFNTFDGTSQATPHVTGAWAILKQRNPQATVDQILAVLQDSGIAVTDNRNNVTKPRIQINSALLQLPAPEWCDPNASIARVSVASDGEEALYSPRPPNTVYPGNAISANGRYVAFISDAVNLVSGDSNGIDDVFIYDRQTCLATRVSRGSDSSENNSGSWGGDTMSMSADGRFIAFISQNEGLNVFIYESQTGQITKITNGFDGSPADSISTDTALSDDGQFVAFASFARNLVPNDTTGGYPDIFVYDRQTNQTERVSVASDGTESDSDSRNVSISADGRYVVFESMANNLVNNDINLNSDVFLHDRQTGQTDLISIDPDGKQFPLNSFTPVISGNGRFIAFTSLGTHDGYLPYSIFVRDRLRSETILASVDPDGIPLLGNLEGNPPSMSGDGRYIAFSALSPDQFYDIYIYDMQLQHSTRLSGINSYRPSISRDGRYIAFASWNPNLVPGDTNEWMDFFVQKVAHPLPPSPPNIAPRRNYYTTHIPTLTWARVSWAIQYEVQIASNSGFSDATTYTLGNELAFTLPSPLDNGTYFWRVKACSTATNCGTWNAPDSFVIDAG